MKLNSANIPMERLNYKIFLDRYAQKDMSKTNIVNAEAGTIVVAITDLSDPKYPQKEICKIVCKLDDGYYLVQNIFEETRYTLPIEQLLEPIELYPKEVWDRVAKAMVDFEFNSTGDISKDEQTYSSWYNLLKDWKFVPAGRILASLGTEFQENLTPYNCFVINSPKDSRKGAIDSLQIMTEMMSRGGGVGINLSSLRPRNAIVRGVNGTSSGAVSWGGGYSYYTGLIEQGGSRRGALLLGLSVWHPDLLEFISSKQEAGKIENANISVLVTEDFMEAVEKDLMWTLRFPDTSHSKYETDWTGNIITWESNLLPVIKYKELPARELWNKIVESAWKSGEPGVIWLERYNILSNTRYYEEIVATNPCLPYNTLIHTDSGWRKIGELYNSQEEVIVVNDKRLSDKPLSKSSKVFKTGTKEVYVLTTKHGYTLELTANHKVLTNRGWVEAKDLDETYNVYIENQTAINNSKKGSFEYGALLGWSIADGYLVPDRKCIRMDFWGDKMELAETFQSYLTTFQNGLDYTVNAYQDKRGALTIQSYYLYTKFRTDFNMSDKSTKFNFIDKIYTYSNEFQKGFLNALFSADGSFSKKHLRISLKSVNKELLNAVQILLLNFNIFSSQSMQISDAKVNNRVYKDHVSYNLTISGENAIKFIYQIGCINTFKHDNIINSINSLKRRPCIKLFQDEFKSLEFKGVEDVYDVTVDKTHAFSANGLVVHNCGEIGLPPWGVCNLGHVNLAQVRLDRDQVFGIDWHDLGKTVRQAVRFLDNIIDIAYYFLDANKQAQINSRRIGLGTMGLAELMIKLGIRYGSEESLRLIDEVFSFIRDIAYDESVELSKERGPFPKFDKLQYIEGNFIKKLPETTQANIFNYGIRNSVLLTQAPTGTVGTMVGTSTGIEPFYQWKYLRKCRLGDDIRYERVAKEYMNDNGLKDISELPSYFVTSLDLTPREHVTVMARIQKYVDNSISKTVNCPSNWTVEQVQEIYKLAYDLGCKGITIYRDGSRDSQVLNTIDDKKDVPDPLQANSSELQWGDKIEVPADTLYRKVKLNTGCGKIILMIGYSESLGRISDVYTIINSTGGCQLNIQGLAITISQYLRLGGDIDKLYQKSIEAGNCGSYQFKRGQGHKDLCGKSCFNAILKTIRDFGLESKDTNIDQINVLDSIRYEVAELNPKLECPSCKKLTLVRQSGCYNCTNCGYSRCE